jgi:hypothetical protein
VKDDEDVTTLPSESVVVTLNTVAVLDAVDGT